MTTSQSYPAPPFGNWMCGSCGATNPACNSECRCGKPYSIKAEDVLGGTCSSSAIAFPGVGPACEKHAHQYMIALNGHPLCTKCLTDRVQTLEEKVKTLESNLEALQQVVNANAFF